MLMMTVKEIITVHRGLLGTDIIARCHLNKLLQELFRDRWVFSPNGDFTFSGDYKDLNSRQLAKRFSIGQIYYHLGDYYGWLWLRKATGWRDADTEDYIKRSNWRTSSASARNSSELSSIFQIEV